MLGRADAGVARPCDHLAHVEMDILAAFGERSIERPRCAVGGQQPGNIALAALTCERIEHPLKRFEHARHDFGGTTRMTKCFGSLSNPSQRRASVRSARRPPPNGAATCSMN